MKRLVSVLLCLLLVFAIILPTAAFTNTSAKWDKKKTKTIVLSTIKGYYTTGLKQIAKEYTALHPETKVQIQIIGSNDVYKQNFITKITTDKKLAPDIIHVNLIDLGGEMIRKKWILPLDGLLDEANPYNGGIKVREAFTDKAYLTAAINDSGKTGYLPYDLVGIGCFYNKAIFKKAGITAPKTYEELDVALYALRKEGYKYPFASSSFTNWFSASLQDWGLRGMTAKFLALPGDAIYDPKTMSQNTKVVYDPKNPAFDSTAIFNSEKIWAHISKVGIDNPITKKVYETLKSVYQYCAPGWLSPNDGQGYNAFLAQKAPIMVTGSWNVGTLVSDISKLPKGKQFDWAVFKFPGFKKPDSNFKGDPRGLLVAGHQLGLTDKKDKDLTARAADFLKFMYSPKYAAKVFELSLKAGEAVQGPSLIKGVKFSDKVSGILDGFKVAGTMRWDLGSLCGTVIEADKPKEVQALDDYYTGKITYEEFIKIKSDLVKTATEYTMKTSGYDLDPKTLDKPAAVEQ